MYLFIYIYVCFFVVFFFFWGGGNVIILSLQRNIFGRKEVDVLFSDELNTFYFTFIWRRAYGKRQLR